MEREAADDSRAPGSGSAERPYVCGKHLYLGTGKILVKGVTYGPFSPHGDGGPYGTRDTVTRDFARMRAQGVNAVRTYTVPPSWLLDLAHANNLHVMIGLPWEQHVTFLDDRARVRLIEEQIRAGVRACAGHPAVLCYVIGNEIPSSVVRWHGAARIERFLERLYGIARDEDAGGLVTYVNYPTTEYLQLPFLDFISFNVYLEQSAALTAYLGRLQNLAGDLPLVMAEVGLDSRRNGAQEQARSLQWQVRTSFESGCAGVFVFSWTDEWHRGGHEVTDWDFGLTTRAREPKPALESVRSAFTNALAPPAGRWPRVSVIVCTYNGAATLRGTLEGLARLEYSDYEVIVIDDGSSDATSAIAGEYDVRLIRTANCGLSCARNTGLAAARGEIVAYIDDDAYPDPHWLTYLVIVFQTTDHAGVGGPNVLPRDSGHIASCVANAPGGPAHVLLTDTEAEHIPGCNMAFRRDVLASIGGFDAQFRVAGDDVDVCWQLQRHGHTLGFSPAAVVWHHRRDSLRAYWKQQRGYGRAEALLERKWPEKYNALGHVAWSGHLYGGTLPRRSRYRRGRIYHGTWGSALFQSVYQPGPSLFGSLVLTPEWYLIISLMLTLSVLGTLWAPLFLTLALVLVAVAAPIGAAVMGAARAVFADAAARGTRLQLYGLTTLLHLMQPVARLVGRISSGLTPWRRYGIGTLRDAWFAGSTDATLWHEDWRAPEQWLLSLESALHAQDVVVVRGGDFDAWDLEVRGGTLGAVRTRTAIEEHGNGRQLIRFRTRSTLTVSRLLAVLLPALIAIAAAHDGAWPVSIVMAAGSALLAMRTLHEQSAAMNAVAYALETLTGDAGTLGVSANGAIPAPVPVPMTRPPLRVWPGDASRTPDAQRAAVNDVIASTRYRANGTRHRAAAGDRVPRDAVPRDDIDTGSS